MSAQECRADRTEGGGVGCRANANQQRGPVGSVATETAQAGGAAGPRGAGRTPAVRRHRQPAAEPAGRRRGGRGAAAERRVEPEPEPDPSLHMAEPPRDIFRLSRDWLSVQEVVDSVSSSRCGAVSVFIGATREDQAEGRKVIGLQYEAYEAMVQSELSRLAAALRARWPSLLHVCIHHRLGWVKVGEASVVMAISSPHRQDGQEAIQHAVTQLKASAPIWKKEVYDTQESSWKENSECSWSQRGGASD